MHYAQRLNHIRMQSESWDSTLASWERPASDSEEAMIERAARMVREALGTNSWLNSQNVTTAAQGSYFNNTNVRTQADMDIRVVHPSILVHYNSNVSALSQLSLGYTDTGIKIDVIARDLRHQVYSTLCEKFGIENVSLGNKAIRISSVQGSRSDIDVVPSLTYHYVSQEGYQPIQNKGIVIISLDGTHTVNYPEQHYRNGVAKREHTVLRFKKVVRMLKSMRDHLVQTGAMQDGKVSSFLIENLVYQVENALFCYPESRYERLLRILSRLENLMSNPLWVVSACEINNIKPLFGANQSWRSDDAAHFIRLALARLEGAV